MLPRARAPNALNRRVKENILNVFERIGGMTAMAEWAMENQTEFYRLYARLLPTEVVATVDPRNARELSDDDLVLIISGGSGEGAAEAVEGPGEAGEIH